MFAAGALSLSAQIHVVEYLGNSKTLVNASKTDSITFAPPATSGTSAGYSSINLVQWDNSVVSFELGNHPKVTWDSQINISTDKAIVSYSFTKIRCIKPDMSTGINATTNEAGKMAFRVDAADKSHLMYLNLLPCMVAPQDLQAKDYEDYVQRFVDEVNITPISYDMYPVVMENGKAKLRPMFYENLEIVRKVSLRNDYPFWAFCLATAHDPYPIPSDTHLRIEAFSALAYGAQCIQYFTYWTPGTTVWNFHNAPIDENGKRTDVYYKVKNVNKEIQALAKVFLGAKATDVSHTGDSIPTGTKSLTQMPDKFQSLQSDGEGILVSQLANGKSRYVMLLNRSIDNTQNITFYLGESVKRITPFNGEEKLNAGRQTVTLTPGNYAIYKIK